MKAIKLYRFPVAIDWQAGKRVTASVEGKDAIEIATPPEFGGGIEGVWSPEDLLVAALASCYAVTLVAVAGRFDVPLRGLTLAAVGHLGARHGGGFGFTSVELEVTVDTDPGCEERMRSACERAEHSCLVSNALAVPVTTDVTIRERAGEPGVALTGRIQ